MTSKAENQFNAILSLYGHDVLVLHHDTRETCECYDVATGSASRQCPYCFGLGYIPTIKKYKTRRVDGPISDTVPRSGNVQNFGAMFVESKHYYFPKDVPIEEEDLIIEVDWDGIRPVYNKGGIYLVSHVHDFRYEQGSILYKKVSVKDKPVNKHIRGFKITKRAGQIAYRLAEGS